MYHESYEYEDVLNRFFKRNQSRNQLFTQLLTSKMTFLRSKFDASKSSSINHALTRLD